MTTWQVPANEICNGLAGCGDFWDSPVGVIVILLGSLGLGGLVRLVLLKARRGK